MLARRPGPNTRRRLRAPALALLLAVLAALVLAAPSLAAQREEAGAATVSKVDTTPLDVTPVDTTPLSDAITGGTKKDGPTATSTSGAIAKMVVGLGIVLVVIYGVYWLLKSAGKGRKRGVAADGRMTVVGTTILSPGRSLHLVKIGDDIVLVGSAEHAVTRVHSWTGEEARRLDDSLATPIDGLADGGAGARLVDELRRRTVRR